MVTVMLAQRKNPDSWFGHLAIVSMLYRIRAYTRTWRDSLFVLKVPLNTDQSTPYEFIDIQT